MLEQFGPEIWLADGPIVVAALEVEAVPEGFQEFNLLSWEGHGKYNVDRARRLLGFEPSEQWERYYQRTP